MRFRGSALGALAVISAACLVLAGCGGGASPGAGGGQTVTLYVSGDTNVKNLWQNTLIPGFQRAEPQYTVTMAFSEHGENDVTTLARLGAAVKNNSDPGEDLIDGAFTQAATSGWTEKVSAANVANLKNVDPKLLVPVDGGSVPYRASAVVLAYDSKSVPAPPTTLDGLLTWIKANPGRFTYNSPATGGSGMAFVTTVLDKTVPPADGTRWSTGTTRR
ncbi:MAG TPA: extracellular solute-binding protein [Pseudonocardia sp.]|jgi:putative spermidine/putrescine transport system substrate-binding protein|nr:extracellular solute-binding protein [Pseudonocardia sp.]